MKALRYTYWVKGEKYAVLIPKTLPKKLARAELNYALKKLGSSLDEAEFIARREVEI